MDDKGNARQQQADTRARRRGTAGEIAAEHGGVAHRRLLREAGVTYDDVRNEVRADRWTLLGKHTVFLGDLHALGGSPGGGPPSWPARAWWAVWESGGRATLDGVSALLAAGLSGWTQELVDVSLPRNSRVRPLPAVRARVLRELRRRDGVGLPRTPVEVAVVRAAQWAVSDKQAATLLAMVVQQRLVAPQRILEHRATVRWSRRRRLLDFAIRDVCDGAQSLDELDFAAACRRYGLPEPTRQHVRRTRTGRVSLDAWWEELRVAVEIAGAQHTPGNNAVDDALRQNEVVLDDAVVLRLPVLGFRTTEVQFMRLVAAALEAAAPRRRPRTA